MARFYPVGGSGAGSGSDDCSGTASELLKGYTGILKGSGDEPVQGTLELTGNAQAAHVLNGETFYTNNAKSKNTGTMPNRGDYNGWGNSKGNDAGNQRMWVKVPQGYYNENANVFLSWADIRNMAGITPQRIKKNEAILGIIGSFEGWVPTPQDLYYNGVKLQVPFVNSAVCSDENTRLYITNGDGVPFRLFNTDFDARSYSKLIFEGSFVSSGGPNDYFEININGLSHLRINGQLNSFYADISQIITFTSNLPVQTKYLDVGSYFTRIRLA